MAAGPLFVDNAAFHFCLTCARCKAASRSVGGLHAEREISAASGGRTLLHGEMRYHTAGSAPSFVIRFGCLGQANHEYQFTDQPTEPAIPRSESSWPFFKFTDEIENGPVYLPFSV